MILPQNSRAAALARRAGFTLTEIVLALGIIATVFVAVLGLLPAGLDASKQAASSTIVASILETVHQRLQNQPLEKGVLPFSPLFFDDRGAIVPAEASKEQLFRRLYRADVKIGEWRKQPEGTSNLRPITVELSWPVNGAGEAIGPDNPKTALTYPATTFTSPDWQEIYPPGRPDLKYEPKIEF